MQALCAIHGIVSSEDQHTRELVISNGTPGLRHLLVSSHLGLREKTCQVICGITTGNKAQIQAVTEASIIPTLIQLLADVNHHIRRYAALAISNVTELGDPEEVKGWIPLLFILLENDTQGILKVSEILEKFLKVVPDSDAWRRLQHLLSSSGTKVREKTCDVIEYITLGNKKQSRAAIEAGIVPVLIKLLADVNYGIRLGAASVISKVIEVGEAEEARGWIPLLFILLENGETQDVPLVSKILTKLLKVVPDSNTWRRFRHLLSSSNTAVRDRACRVIDCITWGNKEQTRAAIEAGIVPVLIKLLVIEVGEPEEARGWIPLLLSL
ncbi:unnamed protein product [Ectocarpus sp. 13 AM-2016]